MNRDDEHQALIDAGNRLDRAKTEAACLAVAQTAKRHADDTNASRYGGLTGGWHTLQEQAEEKARQLARQDRTT